MRAKQNSTGAAFFLSLHITTEAIKRSRLRAQICRKTNALQAGYKPTKTHTVGYV